MSSSSRIDENGHLANTPSPVGPAIPAAVLAAAPVDEPVQQEQQEMPYEILHELLDLILDGKLNDAARRTAALDEEALRFYIDRLGVTQSLLTAQLSILYIRKLPAVIREMKKVAPFLFEKSSEK